jgi:hypothetical protein
MGPRLGLAKEESLTSASIVHKKSLHERKGTYPPIIIIGMHRSGTSLLSRMLEDLGLFLGKIKDENHEAVFFQAINDWLLWQAGGAWDNPTPIQLLLDNPEMSERTSDYIRHYLLTSPRAASYVGWLNYLRHRCLVPLTRPWGWKDPRNTFTLPIWLSIFPRAKIIHLHRSGMDVALSLRRRGRQEFACSSRIEVCLSCTGFVRNAVGLFTACAVTNSMPASRFGTNTWSRVLVMSRR